MVPLNLPYYPFKLKHKDQKIYILDEVRKKYLVLTPEEWVRQHMVQYLVNHRSYPRSLIRIEGGLLVNSMLRRTDLLVSDLQGNPFLLVECKAPHIKLSQDTIDQAARYNSAKKASYIALTNGMELYVFSMNYQQMLFEPINGIPEFPTSDR